MLSLLFYYLFLKKDISADIKDICKYIIPSVECLITSVLLISVILSKLFNIKLY